jgi:hypothetical protein
MPRRHLQEDEMRRKASSDEDVEGHMKRRLDNEMRRKASDEDVEGHMKRRLDNEMRRKASDEDDTEGHRLIGRSLDKGEGDEVKYT